MFDDWTIDMFARTLPALTLLTTLAFSAPSAHGAQLSGTLKVDDKWFEGGIRWTQGPPSYRYRWTVRVHSGVVILCGAGQWVTSNLRSETQQVIRDRGFFIDDQLYYKNMSFFSKVPRTAKIVGSQANCVSTGKPPPKKVDRGVSIRAVNPKKVY
ncbi:MAG: hypothetical protein QNJ44_19090 [Rhodobacter sp.]|nr:hypothetical protein [Rhodobacter sp.]